MRSQISTPRCHQNRGQFCTSKEGVIFMFHNILAIQNSYSALYVKISQCEKTFQEYFIFGLQNEKTNDENISLCCSQQENCQPDYVSRYICCALGLIVDWFTLCLCRPIRNQDSTDLGQSRLKPTAVFFKNRNAATNHK